MPGEEDENGAVTMITIDSDPLDTAVEVLSSQNFIVGLLVGALVSFILLYPGAGGGGLSPSAASEKVETYFSDNSADVPLQGVRVESAERLEGSNLYRLEMVLSAELLNRTIEQNQTAIVDSNARYLFLSQPIDTEIPLADQIGAAGQGATQ